MDLPDVLTDRNNVISEDAVDGERKPVTVQLSAIEKLMKNICNYK